MDIAIDKILPINNFDDYKLHFAVYNGIEQPLDVFMKDKKEWAGWNSYRTPKRDDFNRKYIFSLIRYYHQPNAWLFGGIFRVVSRSNRGNTVVLDSLYQEYIGRLLIDYSGPGTPGRGFLMNNHYPKIIVREILPEIYAGEAFCGYENIEHGFDRLEPIFKQSKTDWKSALENVKGVYLIVDKSNGKKYVGSAYGTDGIWSRWACYIGTGHGWNDELTRLIKKNGKKYAQMNFQFSILDYRPMKTDDTVIIQREQYWKRALLSNAHGYNKN